MKSPWNRVLKLSSSLLVLLLAAARPAFADTLVVTSSNDSGAGTLRNAIADAKPGDTIIFAHSLDGGIIGLSRGHLLIDKDLTIDGSALTSKITISGQKRSRVFMVNPGHTVLLDSLKITKGKAKDGALPTGTTFPDDQAGDGEDGGGILNQGTLEIRRCEISECEAGHGGDILVQNTFTGDGGDGGGIFSSGPLKIVASIVRDNGAGNAGSLSEKFDGYPSFSNGIGDSGEGGGILSTGDSRLEILDSTVSGNRTGNGGRIFAPSFTVKSAGGGGGVRNRGGELKIINSSITDNGTGSGTIHYKMDSQTGQTVINYYGKTGHGGGISHGGGEALIQGSTVANNRIGEYNIAPNNGGDIYASTWAAGIYLHNNTMTIRHSTIHGNRSDGNGTGIIVEEDGTSLIIEHSTISGSPTGIEQENGVFAFGNPTISLKNSIVADNDQDFLAENENGITSLGFNLIGNNVSVETAFPSNGSVANAFGDFVGTDTAKLDPLLGPLADNGGPTMTRLPQPDSRAIDPSNGLPESEFPTDQRGLPRVQQGIVDNFSAKQDIGAVEVQPIEGYFLTFTVTTAADEFDATSTDGTGVSLREALRDLGTQHGAVVFDPAVFNGEAEDTIVLTSGQIVIPEFPKAIDASNIPGGVTISGGESTRIFHMDDPDALIAMRNLHFTRGNTAGSSGDEGGAIRVFDGSLWLEDCRFTHNTAAGHGGAIESRGFLSVKRCTFENNQTSGVLPSNTDGGAIRSTGRIVVSESRFVNNSAVRNGGAIYQGTAGAAKTITDSVFQDNSANVGGAIFNEGTASERSDLTLERCSIVGSQSNGSGGAIENRGTLTIRNTTIADNRAEGNGGGIHNQRIGGNNDSGVVHLVHATVAGNGAGVDGSGIGGGIHNLGTVNLTGSILAENFRGAPGATNAQDMTQNDASGLLNVVETNIIQTPVTFSNIDLNTGFGFIQNVDPLLFALADHGAHTFSRPPRPGSPAIDPGSSSGELVDQLEAPRNNPDLGAMEFRGGELKSPGAPTIQIRSFSTNAVIRPGDTVDFGKAGIDGGYADRSFRISNNGYDNGSGVGNLILTAIPTVSNPVFSVIQNAYAVPLGKNDEMLITVRFNPDQFGADGGTLSISSNDPDYTPFTINIRGRGVAAHATNTDGAGDDWSGTTPNGSASRPDSGIVFWSEDATATYFGLLENTVPAGDIPGSLTVKVGKGGGFSGVLVLDGVRHKFRGAIDAGGRAVVTIDPREGDAFSLGFWLQRTAKGAYRLVGSVTGAGWRHGFDLARNDAGKTNPTAKAGRYTMIIPGKGSLGGDYPQGDGGVSLTVGTTGSIRATGTLGDGTKFSHSGFLSAHDEWPFFQPLYKTGFIGGNLTFRNVANVSDLDGVLQWVKPASSKDKILPHGFRQRLDAIGSLFTPPARGERVLNTIGVAIPNTTVRFSGQNEVALSSTAIDTDWNTANKVGIPGSKTLALAVNAKTGVIGGSYTDPVTGSKLKISGVAFQRQQLAVGAVVSGTETGRLEIEIKNPTVQQQTAPGADGGLTLGPPAAPAPFTGANILIVTSANDSGEGSLRHAIGAAKSGDTIIFGDALDGGFIGLTRGELVIDKDLTIDGSSLKSKITISGLKQSRVFSIAANTKAILRSLRITGGKALNGTDALFSGNGGNGESGGGIHNSGDLEVRNSEIFENEAGHGGNIGYEPSSLSNIYGGAGGGGGGIFSGSGAKLRIVNSTVRNNAAGNGGGARDPSAIQAEYTTISGGDTGSGGGILSHSTLDVIDSTIADNRSGNGGVTIGLLADQFFSWGTGGGISQEGGGTLTVTRSNILRNQTGDGSILFFPDYDPDTGDFIGFDKAHQFAGRGGGIYSSSSLTIEDSTVAGNQIGKTDYWNPVSYSGDRYYTGGVFLNNSDTTIRNSTFSGNADAGIYVRRSSSILTILGSTIVGNEFVGLHGDVYSEIHIGNTIVAGNFIEDISWPPSATIFSENTNLIGAIDPNNTDVTDIFPVGNPNPNGDYVGDFGNPLDPLLGPLADNGGPTMTHLPQPGSRAIDPSAGFPDSEFSTDQRGLPRVQRGSIDGGPGTQDIGAVEVQPRENYSTTIMVTTAEDELDATSTDGTGVSLREAFRDLGTGTGAILFDPTVFDGENEDTITLTMGQIVPTGYIKVIDASNIPGGVTISGGDANRIFHIDDPGAEFDMRNLHFTRGNTTGSPGNEGGAIRFLNGSLRLIDCRFSHNTAHGHGGAIESGSFLRITRCTFENNQTTGDPGSNTDGGAIRSNSRIEVSQSRFVNNTAARNGGAIHQRTPGSAKRIVDSVFLENTSNNNGGAIFNEGNASASSDLTVERCSIAGNLAYNHGGGMDNRGTLTMTNTTIAGNRAQRHGGGIYNQQTSGNAATGTIHLELVTIAGNKAGTDGTGIGGGIHNLGPVTLFDSILAENVSGATGATSAQDISQDDASGDLILQGNNIIQTPFTFSDVNYDAGLILAVDPLLFPLGDYGGNTFSRPPKPGSLAIDQGSSALFEDQLGAPRSFPDLGAVEFRGGGLRTSGESLSLLTGGTSNWISEAAGNYAGLSGDAAFTTLKVSRTGAFSGVLSYKGARLKFKGVFPANGMIQVALIEPGSGNDITLSLILTENLEGGGYSIDADVLEKAGAATVADLRGRLDHSSFHPRNDPAPWQGNYTMLIPNVGNGVNSPAGNGWGTVNVGANGAVKVAGQLGDQTKLTLKGFVSKDGSFLFFQPLYRSTPKGDIYGKVFFRDVPNVSDFDGEMKWTKVADGREARYPGGFALTPKIIGSKYETPFPGEGVLDNLIPAPDNVVLKFDATDLPMALPGESTLTWDLATNKISYTPAGTEKLIAKVSTKNGAFSGSYVDKPNGQNVKFAGVAFQKQGIVAGVYPGVAQTAGFQIDPSDDPAIQIRSFSTNTVIQSGGTIDFGDAGIEGGHADRSFRISNNGLPDVAANLVLTASPSVSNSAFSVIHTSHSAPIGKDDEILITVRFAPGELGRENGTLSIHSNDPDYNPFTIAIRGTGVAGNVTSTDGSERSWTGATPGDRASGPDSTIVGWNASRAATYFGLLESPVFAGEIPGNLSVKVSKKGGLSGVLILSGTKYKFKGALDSGGAATIAISPKGGEPFFLGLQIQQTSGGAHRLVGSVKGAALHYGFDLARNGFSRANPTPRAGRYAMIVLGNGQLGRHYPQGDGGISVTVNTTGSLVAKGTLGDGTKFSHAGFLSAHDEWPLYQPLYQTGFIGGNLTFRNVANVSDFDGVLQWVKPPSSREKVYPHGFRQRVDAIGAVHTPPAAGQRVLNTIAAAAPNTQVHFAGNNGIALTPGPLVTNWDTGNRITIPGSKSLNVTVNAKTGLIGGSYVDALTKTKLQIFGVAFQKQQQAVGTIKSGTESGSMQVVIPN